MKILSRFGFFLLPSVIQGGLSFLMLPVTTFVLDAADFGAFALVSSLLGLGSSLASMGSGYLLSAHFLPSGTAERKGLVSAIFWVNLAVTAAFAAVFLAAWPYFASHLGIAAIPLVSILLALSTLGLCLPWNLACEITVLEGKSKVFAAVTIAQSVVAALATVAGLYVFKLGLLSLFIAGALGALVPFAAGLWVLRPFLGFAGAGRWLGSIFRIGPVASMGNLAESLQTFSERSILSSHVGLAQLGVYNNSQQFRQLVFTGVKAVTRSIWPMTLRESREPASGFAKTGKAWSMVHMGLTMAGVFFATLGRDVIGFLTHGKFTAAAPLVTLWMIFLLIKHSGRAELGYLTAHGHSGFVATLTLVTVCCSIPCLYLLVPRFGMSGAFASMLLQDLGFRAGLTLKARSLRDFEFQDAWVVAGSVVIATTLFLSHRLGFGAAGNLALLAAVECLLLWVAYGKIRKMGISLA